MVYAETLSANRSVFVEASQALGAGDLQIMDLHILPNLLFLIIVRSTIGMIEAILTAGILGHLGVCAHPPSPEWGLAVAEAWKYLAGA